jgi:3-hydroxyisobutyrate dehydrogenase-like beta-hydroxyacid dehydrogenase
MLGGAMVEGMLRRGDAVTVWNRTEAKARALETYGAKVAATPGDAVAGADRVHMTLPDDEVVDQIVAAFTPQLAKDAIVIDHTTASPRGTSARLARLNAAGVKFLHAPVFMSPQMARDSIGIILAAGPQAVYDAALDTLRARALAAISAVTPSMMQNTPNSVISTSSVTPGHAYAKMPKAMAHNPFINSTHHLSASVRSMFDSFNGRL